MARRRASAMRCPSIAVALIVALAPTATLMTSAKAAGLPPETTVNRGCCATRDGSRCRHLGTHRRRSRQHHRRWRDAAGFAVGKGSLRDLTDLKLLRGIDMAILQLDMLDYARQQNVFPGIGDWVTYIAKLYNAEFHLLARKDFTGVTDLANQKVNVDLRGTGTAITAARLFDLLKIPITMTNDDQ